MCRFDWHLIIIKFMLSLARLSFARVSVAHFSSKTPVSIDYQEIANPDTDLR